MHSLTWPSPVIGLTTLVVMRVFNQWLLKARRIQRPKAKHSGQIQKVLLKRERRDCRSPGVGLQPLQENPQKANLAHGNSQSWNQQPGSPQGTYLGSLHVCDSCIAWSVCRTPSNGSRACPGYFDWLLGTCSSCWIVLLCLNTGGGAWSYDRLICRASLTLLWVLLLSEQIRRVGLGAGWEGQGAMEGKEGVREGEEKREGRLRTGCKINKLNFKNDVWHDKALS